MEPVKKLEFKCGTITIFPPEKSADKDDKKRLYLALLECLIEKSPKPIDVQKENNQQLTVK